MKTHILAFLISTFLIISLAASDRSDQNDDNHDITTLTFLVEYEPEDDNDLIEIGLTVQAKDRSLKEAINKARKVVEDITEIGNEFCTDNTQEQINCDEAVDVSDFDISAEYVKRRKDLVFEEFVVSHEVQIKVYDTQKIGELADRLLKTEVTKIDSFDWASTEESDAEEEAIEAGRQKSQQMCFHLGMKLHRIVSIEDVEEDDEEDGGDEEEQDEQQDEEQTLVFRFNVECKRDAQTEAKKNQEEQNQDKQQLIEKQKKQRKNQNDDQDKKPKQKKDKSSEEKKKTKK